MLGIRQFNFNYFNYFNFNYFAVQKFSFKPKFMHFPANCSDRIFYHPTNLTMAESPQHLFAVSSFPVVPCNTKDDLLNENFGTETDTHYSMCRRKQPSSKSTIRRVSKAFNYHLLSYYHQKLGIRPMIHKPTSLAIVQCVDFSDLTRQLRHSEGHG